MKIVINDIFLKYIQSIQINYLILTEIYPSTRKKKNYRGRKTYLRHTRQRKISYSGKKLKKGIK